MGKLTSNCAAKHCVFEVQVVSALEKNEELRSGRARFWQPFALPLGNTGAIITLTAFGVSRQAIAGQMQVTA